MGGHLRQVKACAKAPGQERAGCVGGIGSRPVRPDYAELRLERARNQSHVGHWKRVSI